MASTRKPKPKLKPKSSKPTPPSKPAPGFGIGDFMQEQFDARRDKPAKPQPKSRRR